MQAGNQRTNFLLSLITIITLLSTPVMADSTWNGTGGDNLFSTAGNWGSAPTADSPGTLTFGTDGDDHTVSIDVAVTNLEAVNFTGADGAYTIEEGTGGSLTFSEPATITNNASGYNHTISIDLATTGLTVNSVTNQITISGIISGTTLTKSGDGVLTLSGANTYTGDTIISDSGGTLLVNTTSLPGNVSVGTSATLEFNQGFDGTYAGVISGAGAFTKQGTGNVTLSGTNTYTGGTTITAGTLTGTTTSLQGDIANSGTLVFNQIADGTYSDVISGAGAITKSGAGKLTLSGTNTTTGITTISAGTLNLTGSVAGNVIVDGGTFMGTGSIGGSGTLTVNSGAIVAPGASIGTLTVAGTFDLNTGSYLDVEVSKDASDTLTQDLVAASGAVTLASGSYVRVTDLSTENYIDTGDTFTVITGSTVTDSGASVLDYSASLSFAGSVSGGTDYVLTATRTAFANSATGGNNNNLLGAVDSSLSSSAFTSDAEFVNSLSSLSASGLNDAAEQLSPTTHTTSAKLSSQMSQALSSNLTNYLAARRTNSHYAGSTSSDNELYLADASNDPEMLASVMRKNKERKTAAKQTNYFFRPFGTWFDHDSSDNFVGFDATSVGAHFGIDTLAEDNLVLGIGGAYSHAFINYDNSLGKADVDSFYLTPYASYFTDTWFVDGSVSFGYHRNKTDRDIKFGGISRTAEASYNAYEFSTYLKTGYKMFYEGWAVTPSTSLQYTYYRSDSFEESGAGSAGLEVDANTQQSLLGRLGLNLSTITTIDTLQVAPEIYVGYAHQFIKEDSVSARFVNGTTKFSTDIDSNRDNSVYYGAGISGLISEDISAYFGYEGETFSENQTHALNASITVLF